MTLMETVEIERHARKSSQSSNGRSENRKNSSRKPTSARKKRKQSEAQGEIDQDNIAADLRENFPVIRENFDVLSNIGEGTFSKVYLAQLKACTDEIVAIKHIVPTSAPSRVKNELSCLQKLGGKHNVIGVKTTLRNNDHIAFILPYFKHDKFQTFFRGLTTNEIKDYMRNLFLALEHVHHYNIIHRDVKPSNFLHSRESKRYLLVDFGLAMQAPGTHGILSDEKNCTSINTRTRGNSKERQNSNRSSSTEATKNALKNSLARGQKCAGKTAKQRHESNVNTDVLCKTGHQPGHSPNAVCSFCCSRSGQVAPRAGTPGFRSPEVLMKLPNQTTAVDIWSAGIILLSFLSGRYPFFKAKDDLSSLAQIITIFGSKEAAKAGSLMGKDLTCSPTVTAFELKSLCERLRQKNCTCQKVTRHKRKYKARDVASKRAKIDDNHECGYEELNEKQFSQERVNVFNPNSSEPFKSNRDATTKVQELRRSPRKRQGLRVNDKLENLSTPFGYKTIEHSEEFGNQSKGCGSLEKSYSQRSCLGDCFCIPDAAYDLLSKCLKLDPAQRISASAALSHHFLTS